MVIMDIRGVTSGVNLITGHYIMYIMDIMGIYHNGAINLTDGQPS